LIRTTFEESSIRGIREIGSQILHPTAAQGQGPASRDTGAGAVNMTTEQRRSVQRGEGIYKELCFTCHGADGKGAPMSGAPAGSTLAPPLAGSPRVQGHRDYVVKVLLNGLSGPINGKAYTEVWVPMGINKDEWIASIASYIRNSFGNTAGFVQPADVARVRSATAARKTAWTVPELMASLPVSGVDGTMQRRNVPAGAAHMKTGMLEDTRAVAGYVLAASGKRYVVVAIINHPAAGRGTGAHDALIDWVFRTG